jgi:Molybdopterin cofactor-binding domain
LRLTSDQAKSPPSIVPVVDNAPVPACRGSPFIPGYESCTAQLMPDGTLILSVGIQSHGQGLETTLAQIAHEELGIDPAKGAGDSYLTKNFLMISIN